MNSSTPSTIGRSFSSISPRLARKINGICFVCCAAAQFFVELAPVEAGHAVVANDQIGRLVHDFQQRVGAIGCRVRVAMRREPLHQQVEDQRIIVHDQDFHVLHRSHRFARFPGTLVNSAAAAGFFHHVQIRDLHAAFERFAHVVDRQRRNGRRNERFHLHTRGPRRRRLRGNLNSILA